MDAKGTIELRKYITLACSFNEKHRWLWLIVLSKLCRGIIARFERSKEAKIIGPTNVSPSTLEKVVPDKLVLNRYIVSPKRIVVCMH